MSKRLLKNNYFIVTGAPGSGKTSIILALKQLGYNAIPEFAREIISEQRTIEGEGIYDRNPFLFKELMLSRAIQDYQQRQNKELNFFFDRGIPDILAYSDCFNLVKAAEVNAARYFRYNKTVFFAPSWRDIYTSDKDRLINFDEAKQFGDNLHKIYTELHYDVVELPHISPHDRAEFIIKYINKG